MSSPSSASSARKVILVTGSTGRVGKEVLALLSKHFSKREDGEENVEIRAATRDKSAYAMKLGADETVEFDLTDKKTWRKAMEDVTHLFSSTQDKYIAEHMQFAKFCQETEKIRKNLKHIVRISCFGADTNTNKYDKNTHVSIDKNAQIPLMLQHYWWSEKCFIDAGFKNILTSIQGIFT